MYLAAIDPLALILSNEVYVKINLPRPPPNLAALRELVKGLDDRERKLALDRARGLEEYAKALENVLGS